MSEEGRSETQVEDGNEANSHLLELQDAFVNALTNSGTLGRLRAQLRAAALSLLRGDALMREKAVGKGLDPFSQTRETKVTLLLIQDFLVKNGLVETASILEAEASIKFLNGEESDLSSELIAKTGGNPLESLVSSALSGGVGMTPTQNLTSTTVSSDTPPVEKDREVEEPEDMEVYGALQEYEPSIDFTDEAGPLKEGDYIEIV